MIKYSDSEFTDTKKAKEFVKQCEKSFDDQLTFAVDSLCPSDDLPFITLCGPTCSGKTTAAKKIVSAFEKRSLDVNIVSIDDFYYDNNKLRELSLQKGMTSIDYESADTIDLFEFGRFIEDVADFKKKKIKCPIYDFNRGKRVSYKEIERKKGSIFVFEGIQVFYPQIQEIYKKMVLANIFISTESSININGKIFLPDEIRFLRRLVRDYNFRSTSPEFTFEIWPNVRKNEDEKIFPYYSLCNNKIDSVFACEISLLKPYLDSILSKVSDNSIYKSQAEEIIKKISCIQELPKCFISEDSLYREFI